MAGVGPVQLLTIGFGPDAKFEGRFVEELRILEANGQIRVLDMLFVSKEPSGDLLTMDFQAESMGDTVAALLGISRERIAAAKDVYPSVEEGYAFGLTLDEIREAAESLDPGTGAVFVLLEHVWAAYLRKAVRDAGGVPIAEGFLTEEALEPIAAELMAAAQRLGEPVTNGNGKASRPGQPTRNHHRRA
ncbi:DUF1269 domain-containing protein [Streptomyces sp. NPDC059009]|uniref:DUF1269 domain-containing protein n=1 Tax=Streptomyces sp. NPDC059009 TaxID=3346694 RepID=UPI0036C78946